MLLIGLWRKMFSLFQTTLGNTGLNKRSTFSDSGLLRAFNTGMCTVTPQNKCAQLSWGQFGHRNFFSCRSSTGYCPKENTLGKLPSVLISFRD